MLCSHCSKIFDSKRTLDELYYHSKPTTVSGVVWHVDGCGLSIGIFWGECRGVISGMKDSILVWLVRVHI
jgi:hypothetical protein